ncbi:MAG TPA: 4'-phosphopantetheinyl transferase superfamily protein [Puia sp.]|nr:4'-phosphopantetheinyl transferase superfamily protein [Puia sp.]
MPLIQADTIDNVEWKTDHRTYLTAAVDIWKISISAGEKLSDFFLQVCNKEERAKASRYHNEKDRLRYIFGRGALRILSGKYLNKSPGTIQFVAGAHKKPVLNKNSGGGLHFNISHSGDFVLIAISNSEVGVDIEKINADFSYREILETNFSKEEIELIIHSKNPVESFYLLWTRKESLVKAMAKGLIDDLNSISVLDGSFSIGRETTDLSASWDIHSFSIAEQYLGSLACAMGTETINFFETSPSFFL